MLDELRYSLENYLGWSWQVWLSVIERYNRDLFPAQPIGFLLGGLLLFLLIRIDRYPVVGRRLLIGLTGGSWLFVGAIFHLQYLEPIDWSAQYSGIGMISQGLVMLAVTLVANCRAEIAGWRHLFAGTSVALGVFGYPILQLLAGNSLHQLDGFGTGTAGVTLVTAGVVVILARGWAWLLILPWLWSLRQFTISWPLGDTVGMLLLPWLTMALAVAIAGRRRADKFL